MRLILIVCLTLLATACGGSKYEKMSDSELREKKRHCDSIPKKSAVFANGCENIKKEIQRRKKAKRK